MDGTIPLTEPSAARATRVRRVASLIAIAGVIGYVIADVVLQFLPPHYTAISQAESDLAVGPFGWIMSINFFGRGITSAALIAFFLLALAAFWVLANESAWRASSAGSLSSRGT
jgi:hypothetical protein